MWSGPRNISTALMRSFESRGDCHVTDEPLYAHYLVATGLDHPLLAVGDADEIGGRDALGLDLPGEPVDRVRELDEPVVDDAAGGVGLGEHHPHRLDLLCHMGGPDARAVARDRGRHRGVARVLALGEAVGGDRRDPLFELAVEPVLAMRGEQLEQADDEEPTIARAAIETLRALSLTPDVIPTLLQLSTNGRHAEARRYAVEKLGRSGDNKAVNTLVELLDSDDPAARETAARALSHMDSAAAALIKALPEAMSDEKRLTRLVHLIKPHARALTAAQKTTIAELAVGAVEKGSAISTPLLALLRATDPAGFAEKLTDKAMRLKRAKKFKEAFSLFRRLDEASMLGEDEARYAALVSGLCATDAKKDLGRATRTTDPILRQAVELVTVGYPVARKLKKDRTLTPEDLFFVGFNFAESQDEDEREFGGELLSHLAETSPRSKLGKSAKNKLRLVGIA